jgi:rare lipoprotein A (peptidoglycan hydrolase)
MMKYFFKKQFLQSSVFFGGLGVLMSFSFMAQAESNKEMSFFEQASVQAIAEETSTPALLETATETALTEEHESFFEQSGKASWYGPRFHGRRTACGEKYDMHDFTAAHRTLPFGTIVRVTNPANGKTALVRITDRGPFHGNRIIDLSYAAAKHLDVTVTKVHIEAFKTAVAVKNDSTMQQSVAFSPDDDAVVIPLSEFSPVDSLSDFTDALNEQDKLSKKMAGQTVFVALKHTVENKGKKAKISTAKYYVGVLKAASKKISSNVPSIVQVKTFK